MTIKRFNEPEPTTPEPTTPDPVKDSPFSPLNKREEPTESRQFGTKAWSATGDKEGKYSTSDLADAMLVKAADAYRNVENLVKLYDRAIKNPTRENVIKYSKAVYALLENGNDDAASLLSVSIATIYSLLGGGTGASGRK